jgi:hypothetical protein
VKIFENEEEKSAFYIDPSSIWDLSPANLSCGISRKPPCLLATSVLHFFPGNISELFINREF